MIDKTLYPGTVIPISDGKSITVYPVRFADMKKYMRTLYDGFMELSGKVKFTRQLDGSIDPADYRQFIPYILPLLLDDLWGLVCECCSENPDDLPHWFAPKIAEAFVKENFGEEYKRNPWIEAIEDLIEKISGKRLSILGMYSKFVSLQATTAPTSSQDNSTAPPA